MVWPLCPNFVFLSEQAFLYRGLRPKSGLRSWHRVFCILFEVHSPRRTFEIHPVECINPHNHFRKLFTLSIILPPPLFCNWTLRSLSHFFAFFLAQTKKEASHFKCQRPSSSTTGYIDERQKNTTSWADSFWVMPLTNTLTAKGVPNVASLRCTN